MATDNEIKVLLTADLAGLQTGMTAAADTVAATSEAITAAVEESASAVEAAQVAISESAGAAAEALSAAMEESAAAIASAQAETMASVAAEAAAFNAGVQAKIAAQVRLNAAFAGGAGSAGAIAEAEAALDQAMAAGAITAAEYAGYVDTLNAAEVAMADAVTAATAATAANTEAMVINGGVARELGVMIGELARGNYTRLEGSTITLANRTGLLAKAFTPLGLAVAAASAAVLAFGVAAVKGAEEQDKFNRAVLMTGGAVGVSSGAVQEMAQSIGDATGSYSKANEAMLAIVQSGRFASDELQSVGKAAVDMSRLTGESVDQTVQEFVKLREQPVQAVVELNDKYHFLTQAIFDQIEALQQQGDVEEAARIGQEALSGALQKRASEAEAELNGWGKAWHALGEEASWAWNAMMHSGETDSVEQQIDKVTAKLKDEESVLRVLRNSSGVTGALVEQTQVVNGLTQQLNQLVATRDKMREQDAAEGAKQKQIQQYTEDAAALDKWNAGLKDNLNLQQQIAAKKAEVERVHKEDPNSSALKGYTFDASGAVTGGEQWAATVAKLTKEYSNAGSEARKAAQEAKKAAAEQMNDLEMVRAGTAANTADRIQADAAVLASATRLYGANSSQQKAALAQMLADEKAYDKAVQKAREDAAQQQERISVSAAQSALDIKREQIETAFALGNSSRQQELVALQAANEAEYQEEMKAFAKELTLLDAKSKAVEEVEAKIAALQKKYALETQKTTDDQQKALLQSWQKALRPIDSAFQQSITGMIQGTQTFKKGLDNILLSIVASYAQMGLKMVTDWIAREATKTAATTVGAEQRAVVEQAAATQSKVIDAATGKSQITSAAATGAAKAYQAIVGIPYVGPILAPIAAGVAFAGIEAFSASISSARGGWDRVPIDGAMTELHKDEMVLPKPLADGVRQMTKQGGQGGGQPVHIHTTDPRSFKDYLRRNPAAVASALKLAGRRGHLLGSNR